MANAIADQPFLNGEEETCFANQNPAVARCLRARKRVYDKTLAEGTASGTASYDADKAYCKAMPSLSGYENIRDFVACTAYGMLIRVFLDDHAAKLLYAAQVAGSVEHRQSSRSKPAA
jgi:hypothetical protein